MEREEVLYDWHQRSVYRMGWLSLLLEMEFTLRLKVHPISKLYVFLCFTSIVWLLKSVLPFERFPEVAELLRVCWLDVQAKIEMRLLSANTYYAAYFIFKFVHGNYGFENQAVEVSIFAGSTVGGRKIYLDPDGRLRQQYLTSRERYQHLLHDAAMARLAQARDKQIPRDRGDGWKEVDLGEFFVRDPPTGEVQINLTEVKSGSWKSGLVIQGIELRPTHMTSRESSRQPIGQQR